MLRWCCTTVRPSPRARMPCGVCWERSTSASSARARSTWRLPRRKGWCRQRPTTCPRSGPSCPPAARLPATATTTCTVGSSGTCTCATSVAARRSSPASRSATRLSRCGATSCRRPASAWPCRCSTRAVRPSWARTSGSSCSSACATVSPWTRRCGSASGAASARTPARTTCRAGSCRSPTSRAPSAGRSASSPCARSSTGCRSRIARRSPIRRRSSCTAAWRILLDTGRSAVQSPGKHQVLLMTRFNAEQLAFARSQSRYLGRAEAIAFLKRMDIKMSVGHWSAGDFCDRFAPPGYHSDDTSFKGDFEAQCKRTHAAGIDAIEIHQSVFEKTLNGDIDWPALERARDGYLRDLGMRITACNVNTWTNPRFRLGGPCNPNPALRRAATDEILKAVEIAQALKLPIVSVWPGSDGADYHFQIDYQQGLEWFTEALVTANRECLKAGIKLAIEPKPYEPRELYMIIPTAASAILVAQRMNQLCGGTNCRLTIDYGHQKMEGTTASTACDLAAYAGVPVHKFDINDARQGRNDH